MANEAEDPREGPFHPRFSENVVGHREAQARFAEAFAAGRLHHAWLLTGPKGVGKATLAYKLAEEILSRGASPAHPLVVARSHPDLFVLERQMGESKAAKLKQEISVSDARDFGSFFARTAALAKHRVAMIDAVDDLNTESANALLKVLEEPPPHCFIFLICNLPGSVLRTIRSRCVRLDVTQLSAPEVDAVFEQPRFDELRDGKRLALAKSLANGSPGRALLLANSEAGEVFSLVSRAKVARPEGRLSVVNAFKARTLQMEDFELFVELLTTWLSEEAKRTARTPILAEAYQSIQNLQRKTLAFNLDRKLAIMESLVIADDALKAA
jgi:DNA polymerase III subunit delta'